MFCTVISTQEEFDKAVALARSRGFFLACISNAGLDHPQRRLTFLSDSCLRKPGAADPPRRKSVNVREWVKQFTAPSGPGSDDGALP